MSPRDESRAHPGHRAPRRRVPDSTSRRRGAPVAMGAAARTHARCRCSGRRLWVRRSPVEAGSATNERLRRPRVFLRTPPSPYLLPVSVPLYRYSSSNHARLVIGFGFGGEVCSSTKEDGMEGTAKNISDADSFIIESIRRRHQSIPTYSARPVPPSQSLEVTTRKTRDRGDRVRRSVPR